MREVMNIFALGEKVLRGGSITRAEASKLANTAEENLPFLLFAISIPERCLQIFGIKTNSWKKLLNYKVKYNFIIPLFKKDLLGKLNLFKKKKKK